MRSIFCTVLYCTVLICISFIRILYTCPALHCTTWLQDHAELFADTEILYLDCNLLGPFLDEGILLSMAFSCFRASPPGTYLLLLTRQSPRIDFQAKGFKVMYQKKHTPSGTIGNFWLCQKI